MQDVNWNECRCNSTCFNFSLYLARSTCFSLRSVLEVSAGIQQRACDKRADQELDKVEEQIATNITNFLWRETKLKDDSAVNYLDLCDKSTECWLKITRSHKAMVKDSSEEWKKKREHRLQEITKAIEAVGEKFVTKVGSEIVDSMKHSMPRLAQCLKKGLVGTIEDRIAQVKKEFKEKISNLDMSESIAWSTKL